MAISTDSLSSALKHYYGYNTFRNGQEEVISSVLNGKNTLVVMPTGGGKSLCYQLPAILMEGTALVISPLIALMKDQTDALQRTGIPAAFINSSLTYAELMYRMEKALKGEFKLLYIAPERLGNQKFLDLLQCCKISFLAVDEAHCISEWGHDFRPSYRSISQALPRIGPVPIMALTATATPDVQEDIISSLGMKSAVKVIRGFDRPNLSYLTEQSERKLERVAEICKDTKEGSTIIYCGSRKRVEMFSDGLKKMNVKSLIYHAGMPDNFRKIVQEEFISGKTRVIIATNAFGMGIDKPDVRNVIHCDLTQTLEAYYQEAGRAGRDNQPAKCYLLHHSSDRRLQEYFINTTFPALSEIEKIYNTLYDLNNTRLGTKPLHPVFLDETQIANRASLPVNSVYSIMNLFERSGITRRGSTLGVATIKFTTSRERIVEYFNNTTDKRKEVLEALLRSISSEAFGRSVEFDFNHLIRKHYLNVDVVLESIRAFEFARLLTFTPAGTPEGLILLLERMPFNRLPVDFDKLEERKEMSYKKLDVVQRYISTNECKRNFILEYFRETDIKGKCGKCTSCTSKKHKESSHTRSENALLQKILSGAVELDGRFGRSILADLLKGKRTTKIEMYGLHKAATFGSAENDTPYDIKTGIEKAVSDGYLALSASLYPTVSASEKGFEICNEKPRRFQGGKPDNDSGSNEIYEKLKILRDELASREGIVARAVISDISMRKIAQFMPKNRLELAQLPGIGPIFISKFGELFLQVLNETAAKEKNNPEPPKARKLSDEEVIVTELLNKNNSIEKISEKTGMGIATVARTLQSAVENGAYIDKSKLVTSDVYDEVMSILIKKPKAALKSVRYELTREVDYPLLRVVVAMAKQEIDRLNKSVLLQTL